VDSSVSEQEATADLPIEEMIPSEEHLAERGMFLKGYDLLDLDHGHFWYKVLWRGIHVEFPSRLHHYEPDAQERRVRDYFVNLPVGVLDETYAATEGARTYTLCHGDHCFEFVWDDEVQRHLHCFYERSAAGKERDRRRYEEHMRTHTRRYETDRQFPSWRLHEELRRLKEERAKAQRVVESWDRLIVQCQERIAEDELIHLGKVEHHDL
jgi:hypothetical protein